MGVLITLMVLVHPLHPIRIGPRNKRRNLWFEWCVFSWRPWFWPIYSICYIHTIHYSCKIYAMNGTKSQMWYHDELQPNLNGTFLEPWGFPCVYTNIGLICLNLCHIPPLEHALHMHMHIICANRQRSDMCIIYPYQLEQWSWWSAWPARPQNSA